MAMDPYPWQLKAAERARATNIILNAETGSGKTLVAQLAIKWALEQCPQRKVAFIVTTSRLLAHQQFERIRQDIGDRQPTRHTVVEVTGYTAGNWGCREWKDCRTRANVLVGTAEIFSRAFIDHGFLHFSEFSLLVIDECHHARGESHAAEILRKLHQDTEGFMKPSETTRVLGLTASYASGKAEDRQAFSQSLRDLQNLMQAQVETCSDISSREEPNYVQVKYPELENADYVKNIAEESCTLMRKTLTEQGCVLKEAQKLIEQLSKVLLELGLQAFLFAIEHGVIAQIEAKIDNLKAMWETQAQGAALESKSSSLEPALRHALQNVQGMPALQECPVVTGKVERLIAELALVFGTHGADPEFCGMVFVQEVVLAIPLADLLRKELGQDVSAVSGTESMKEEDRNLAFDSFRRGASRLLVCTTCAEEGVDVAACTFVVRFSSFHTTRSHIQGVGRARRKQSFVYYFNNDVESECQRAKLMHEVAHNAGDPQRSKCSQNREMIPGIHPYIVLQTNAEVNFKNASTILQRYVSKVTGDGASVKSLMNGSNSLIVPGPLGGFRITDSEVHRFFDHRIPPGSVNFDQLIKYLAVLVLHARVWLDSHNFPKNRVAQRTLWPLPTDDVPHLILDEVVFPPGILSGTLNDQSSTCSVPKNQHHKDSVRRDHASSGSEQIHLERVLLDPARIKNTQATVNKTFSKGGSVIDAIVGLIRGDQKIEDFPCIRVAMQEETKIWHSADNRRLFMFKVVSLYSRQQAPLSIEISKIAVDTINWTSEFDCKNNQVPRFGEVWTTDDDSIMAVCKEVHLVLSAQNLSGGNADGAGSHSVAYMPVVDPSAVSHAERLFENLAAAEVGQKRGLDVECPSLRFSRHRTLQGKQAASSNSAPSSIRPIFEKEHISGEGPLHTPEHELAPSQRQSCVQEVSETLINGMNSSSAVRGPAGCPSTQAEPAVASLGAPHADIERSAKVRPPPPEMDRVLKRTAASLARALGDGSTLSADNDPVSHLNLALQGHFKPSSGEEMPIDYNEVAGGGQGFGFAVTVCGYRFLGPIGCRNKKEAKKLAALEAVRGLLRLHNGDHWAASDATGQQDTANEGDVHAAPSDACQQAASDDAGLRVETQQWDDREATGRAEKQVDVTLDSDGVASACMETSGFEESMESASGGSVQVTIGSANDAVEPFDTKAAAQNSLGLFSTPSQIEEVQLGIALADFDGADYGIDYLCFRRNQRIFKSVILADGWTWGKLEDGRAGWFPPEYWKETDCAVDTPRLAADVGDSVITATSAHASCADHVSPEGASCSPEAPTTQQESEVSQDAHQLQPLLTTASHSSFSPAMNIRQWCTLQQLPEALADRLQAEDVQSPSDLTELSEADIEELCAGLKLGHKGRFKRCVKDLM